MSGRLAEGGEGFRQQEEGGWVSNEVPVWQRRAEGGTLVAVGAGGIGIGSRGLGNGSWICSRSGIFAGGSGTFAVGSGILTEGAGFTVRPIDKQLNNIGSVATVWLRAERAELMGPCSAQWSAGTPARE